MSLHDEMELELKELEKRYGSQYSRKNLGAHPGQTNEELLGISVVFHCSDPDFPFAIPQGFHLTFTIDSASYPQSNPTLSVTNPDSEVPSRMKSAIILAVEKYWKSSTISKIASTHPQKIKLALKFLDKNIGMVLSVVMKIDNEKTNKLAAANSTLSSHALDTSSSPLSVSAASAASSTSFSSSTTSQAKLPVMPSTEDDWSAEQQRLLEAALKQYPKTLNMDINERWDKIAAMVTGKTENK